jgi:hypothetical protein
MDPVSRRFVWKHIDRIKDGRVVLLVGVLDGFQLIFCHKVPQV